MIRRLPLRSLVRTEPIGRDTLHRAPWAEAPRPHAWAELLLDYAMNYDYEYDGLPSCD